MLVHRGIVVESVHGLAQLGFGQIVLAHLEVNPAQRVQVGSILRVQGNRAADQRQRLFEPGAAVGQHVAQIVERGRALGIGGQNFAEVTFGLVIFLLALVDRAGDEVDVVLLVLLGGKLQRLGQCLFRVRIAAQAAVHLHQRDPDLAVTRWYCP